MQLLEMKSREDRMSGQLSVLQEALRTAQNDAAALRARLESRRSGCIEGPDPASSVRGAQLCPPDGRKASGNWLPAPGVPTVGEHAGDARPCSFCLRGRPNARPSQQFRSTS